MPVNKLLIISNGHGEDAIGAEIARRLPKHIEVHAYPTLGDGRAYAGVCTVVGPRAQLASQGWRNTRHSFLRDLQGGLIGTVWPGLRFFREARKTYDRIAVVGDMIGVYGCYLTGHRDIVYLDVYKTGFGRSYLAIDKWMLKRAARTVFCRAQSLADTLRAAGIDARAPGNIMMDTIPRTGLVLARTKPRAMAILPGSRAHAVKNFALQVAALAKVPMDLRPDLFVVVAASLQVDDLAKAAGLSVVDGRMNGQGLDIAIVPGASLGDTLDASDLVLSQAGTATIQALGLGRPAITFQSSDDRPSRVAHESRLFGDAREVVVADADTIASALSHLLADDGERARRAAIGRERIGSGGAMTPIIAALTA